MDVFTAEYFQLILSPQAQVTLSHYLIIVAVVWGTMGRKVSLRFKEMQAESKQNVEAALNELSRHFLTIEKTLDNAVQEVRGLKETVSKDLKIHSDRLAEIENSFTGLSTRVERLEQLKGEE